MVFLIPACTSGAEDRAPGTVGGDQMVVYQKGTDALWYITISGTEHEDIGGGATRCIQDPAIVEWWTSPGDASSDLSLVLPPHATEDDAQRVVGCFREERPDNPLILTRPTKNHAG